MFHDVRLDERQRRAGLISEDVHGHVKRGLIEQQHLKARVFIAKERLACYIALVAQVELWRGDAGQRLIFLLEDEDSSGAGPPFDLHVCARGKEDVAAGVEAMPALVEQDVGVAFEQINEVLIGASVALAFAVSVRTLVNSVWMDVLLAKTDTRVLAGRWLAARVKPEESLYDAGGAYAGASLVGLSMHRWTVETFDPTRNAFTNSSGRLPDWLVLPESPLGYGTVPMDLRRLSAEKYELAQTIPATRLQNDASVYDLQDAFFLPMSGFQTVIRPGPTIRIFRRLQSPR